MPCQTFIMMTASYGSTFLFHGASGAQGWPSWISN